MISMYDPLLTISEEEARELAREHPRKCSCRLCAALQILDNQ